MFAVNPVLYHDSKISYFRLEPPKRQAGQTAFKTWEEEERKGPHGTVPQLLFAHSSPELAARKMQCTDKLEWYKS